MDGHELFVDRPLTLVHGLWTNMNNRWTTGDVGDVGDDLLGVPAHGDDRPTGIDPLRVLDLWPSSGMDLLRGFESPALILSVRFILESLLLNIDSRLVIDPRH